jgi:hypothetical protein
MRESQTTPEARYLLTRFSRSLYPRGMTTGAPRQTATLAAPVLGNTPPSPASLSLCRHGFNSGPPLIFMRSPGYKSPTRTLHPTANTTPSPNITNQYTIFHTIPTNLCGTRLPHPHLSSPTRPLHTLPKDAQPANRRWRTGMRAPSRTTAERPSFGRHSSPTSRAQPHRIYLATGSLASSRRPRRQSAPRWRRAPLSTRLLCALGL